MTEKIEITLKVDPTDQRHVAAVVLFKEIEKLERAYNALDAKLEAVRALCDDDVLCRLAGGHIGHDPDRCPAVFIREALGE